MKLLLLALLAFTLRCIAAIRLPHDAWSQSVPDRTTTNNAQWRYDVESSFPLPHAPQDPASLSDLPSEQPFDEDELDSAAAGNIHEQGNSSAAAAAEQSTVRNVLQVAGRAGRQLLQLLLNNYSPIRVQGVTTFANGPAAASGDLCCCVWTALLGA
jgi:hypothetical protein